MAQSAPPIFKSELWLSQELSVSACFWSPSVLDPKESAFSCNGHGWLRWRSWLRAVRPMVATYMTCLGRQLSLRLSFIFFRYSQEELCGTATARAEDFLRACAKAFADAACYIELGPHVR